MVFSPWQFEFWGIWAISLSSGLNFVSCREVTINHAAFSLYMRVSHFSSVFKISLYMAFSSWMWFSLHLSHSGFVGFLESVNGFHQIWEVFSHYLFKFFFFFLPCFLGIPSHQCWDVSFVPKGLGDSLCFHASISVLKAGWFLGLIFRLPASFFC